MKIDVKICTKSIKCGIKVIDYTTVSDDGYLMETSNEIVKNRFKKSETVAFNVFVYNSLSGKKIYSLTKSNIIQFKKDGWYTLFRVIIPTKEWVEKGVSGIYSKVYCSDGDTLLKYENEQYKEITVEELVLSEIKDSTISFYSLNYVNVCYLKQCFVELNKKIFNTTTKCFDLKVDKHIIQKRDIVFMTITTIDYLVDCNMLAEAQRTIENVQGCNGLCNEEFKKIGYESNCGCS